MGMWAKEKKYLCAAGLLAITRKAFTRIKEPCHPSWLVTQGRQF
ncbi:hypothetical protein NEOC65_001166 [Neochlamydia sp. AcF65]|nr:hypothetical protein [Neochlamydia sp. AcF65]MBS4166087.1 hypothetical protein [Neochlamydia sp. AcF65]